MNRSKLLLFPVLALLALTTLLSCGQDRWAEYYPLTQRDLWMDSVMREVYLWHEDIPEAKSLNYFQEPQAFFKSILSPKDKGFSTVDTIDNTLVQSYGFDYTLYKVATSDSTYNALVSYVLPNSPASDAGLERGEWIMLIDGDSITKKTEKWLADGGTRELRIGKYVVQTDEEDQRIGFVRADRDAMIPATRAVGDNVVHKKAIFTTETTGRNIAYLAYNAFSAGPTKDSQEYNNELREFSQQCKHLNVDDFILDLRYNAGGEMECVQLLADILVPADKLESPLASLQYNTKQTAKNRDLMLDSKLLQAGANLNLPKVYMITSSLTAGAAEMLINCLKPYMEVVIIGQKTKGENIATETFINPKYSWVLRPAVCEVFNSNGEAEYSEGFKPEYSINEYSYPEGVLPLGNPDEVLLNTALNIILGNIEPPKPSASSMKAVKNIIVRRDFRNGLIVK